MKKSAECTAINARLEALNFNICESFIMWFVVFWLDNIFADDFSSASRLADFSRPIAMEASLPPTNDSLFYSWREKLERASKLWKEKAQIALNMLPHSSHSYTKKAKFTYAVTPVAVLKCERLDFAFQSVSLSHSKILEKLFLLSDLSK